MALNVVDSTVGEAEAEVEAGAEVREDLLTLVVVVVHPHFAGATVVVEEDLEDAFEEGMWLSLPPTCQLATFPSSVFMRGQPANIDRRIADDSDKVLVAKLSRSRPHTPDKMPLRPDFGTSGREIKLRANFFPVRIPKGPLYEYDVSITPAAGTATRRVKKRIYQLAEQTASWQQAGMSGRVAHDSSAKLISAFELPQPLDIRVPYYDEDETGPPQTGGKEYTLTIQFIQEIDTGDLVRYLLQIVI